MNIQDFHLDTEPNIALLETITVSHSAWDEPLYITSNHADGFDAQLEDGSDVFFTFEPLLIKKGSISDDLEQSITITIGDLGLILPQLIDKIREQDSDERPSIIYRAYAFDASAMQLVKTTPIDVISGLYVTKMDRDVNGTSFTAKNTDKNATATGVLYTFSEFPDLKGFL